MAESTGSEGGSALGSPVGLPRGSALGSPREHHGSIDSTNRRARELAAAGAAHGTLVTAGEQTAGRGRQGRSFASPPGTSLSMSLVIRPPHALLSLAAGVAVAETVDRLLGDRGATIKWPNDVLVDSRKVAGILVEGAPQQRWAVLGIGLNVAIEQSSFPDEIAERAGTLGLSPDAIEPALAQLLAALDQWLVAPPAEIVAAVRTRDALFGQTVSWDGGAESGTAIGIDEEGRLLVRRSPDSSQLALEAGEVHLSRAPAVPTRATSPTDR